jgi:glycolate oxidase FAD binding subunit
MEVLHPNTKGDVADMFAALSSAGTSTLIVGGRQDMGRVTPRHVDAEVWTTQLDGVIAYDPAEMLAVVEAGMRIRDLDALLADGGQEWPMDAHPDATVGGVIATGVSGSRRLRTGMMRDSVVEVELVTGDGRLIRSGARTVKNVTGFDIHHLATGAFGSLGAIVQVAIKVRPLPKVRRTVITGDGGMELATALLNSVPLPAAIIAEPDSIELVLEGWPEEVDEQIAAARSVTEALEIHDDRPTTRVDERWPDAPMLAEIGVAPSRVAALVAEAPNWRALAGVGLVWLPVADPSDLPALTSAVTAANGTLASLRGDLGPSATATGALVDISARLRASFDPSGILS